MVSTKNRCTPCRYLEEAGRWVRRTVTERKRQKQAEQKEHWTKIEERYLTRAFKEARDAAGCYADWTGEEQPGFHEIRALSLHLYKKAGKDGQRIAGHASEEMTKNYQRDHAEVIWSEAIPDLDIAEIAG